MENCCKHTDQVLNTEGLVDLIDEIRLRTWARLNYRRPEQRSEAWHPVIHQEMDRKDLEAV